MFSGFSFFEDSLFTRLSYVLGLLFLAFLFLLFKDILKQLKGIKKNSFKFVWLGVALVFFFGFWLCFPGLMVIDDAVAAKEIFAGHPYTWLSLSYAFLLASGYMLMGQVGFIPVFSITLYCYLLLRAFRIVSESAVSDFKKWICILLLAGLSINPLIQGLLIFHSRDIIFSLAVSFIGLLFFESSLWTKKEIILLSALVVFLADLRADGKLYLGLVPVLFYFAKKWSLKQMGMSFAVIAGLGLIYLGLLPYVLDVRTMDIGYKITTWVSPLSQIYHDVGVKNIDSEITAKIDPVLNVEKLEKNYSPVDIDAFHAGAFNGSTNEQQWSEFKTAALKLILDHPDIYIKNRVQLFMNMLNISHETFIYYDDFHGTGAVSFEIRTALRQPPADYSFSGLSEKYYNFLGWWGRSRNILIQLFNSLLLPLLFTIYCVRYFKSRPEFFCFAAVVIIRVPVIFLLAPSSYTRYIFTVLLFFVLGGPLLLLRTRNENPQS